MEHTLVFIICTKTKKVRKTKRSWLKFDIKAVLYSQHFFLLTEANFFSSYYSKVRKAIKHLYTSTAKERPLRRDLNWNNTYY